MIFDKFVQTFFLTESHCDLLCTEIAKKAIEEAGLTDIQFEELEVK